MKVDVSSTVLEKGVQIAKDFVDKLIIPSVEETGLLIKEKVTYWRFKNQVSILNKAKEYCDKHNIQPREISLKLLCPLLDYAGLEEDENLQNNWAILLSNLVDSEQNIQNHVFPYILSQLSKDEFAILKNTYLRKKARIANLTNDLATFVAERPKKEKELTDKIEGRVPKKESESIWIMSHELRMLDVTEVAIKNRINDPEIIGDSELKEYELLNLSRLGLIKFIQQHYVSAEPIELPDNDSPFMDRKIDLDISIESDGDYYYFTELGDLFISACLEKVK